MVFEPPCCLRPGGAAVHASMWLQAKAWRPLAGRVILSALCHAPRTQHCIPRCECPSPTGRASYRAPSTKCPEHRTWHRAPRPWLLVARRRALYAWHSVRSRKRWELGAWHLVLSTQHWAPPPMDARQLALRHPRCELGARHLALGVPPQRCEIGARHLALSPRDPVLSTRHLALSAWREAHDGILQPHCGQQCPVVPIKGAAPRAPRRMPPTRTRPPRTEHKVG
jgi:hypothetical protein